MKVSIKQLTKYACYGSLHIENLMYLDDEYMGFMACMTDDQIKRFAKDYFSDDDSFNEMSAEDIYNELKDVFVVVRIDDHFDLKGLNYCYLFAASDIGYDFDMVVLGNAIEQCD